MTRFRTGGFRPRKLYFLALLSLTVLLWGVGSPALLHAANHSPARLPADVSQTLALLVDAVQTKQAVDVDELLPLLNFVRNTATSEADWEIDNLHGATGAYHGYEISSPVEKIITYLYQPGVPSSLFHPSVVRVGAWEKEPQQNVPLIWEQLNDMEIQAVYGMEKEENTPDTNTGGYYSYNTDRLLLLLRKGDAKYLISVSKQIDRSSVGRKGVVLGDDADWNYYYSDEEGLTRGGLGWVNSYIFDSFSVTVLSACQSDPARSQHLMFKWVRAGWSGINMVRTEHVRDGCRRFAQSLTKLMESDFLPDVYTIIAMSDHILSMDQVGLEKTLEPYVSALRVMSAKDPVLSRRPFKSLVDENPLKHYSLQAKQSLIMKEYMKASIGMPALLTLNGDLFPALLRLATRE